MEVIETDLGELIIQQVHEKPFHLVFPAVHKTVEDVAEIFRKATGEDIPDDADAVMKVVRRFVRPYFLNADIGMHLVGNHFGFHIACHQRALGSDAHANAFLNKQGADVEVIESGTCCGMAGTFGLKEGMLGYELSQAVGEPLF